MCVSLMHDGLGHYTAIVDLAGIFNSTQKGLLMAKGI